MSTHRARLLLVLWHQVRSPLLGLLLVAAVASYFVGERSDAGINGVVVALSVSLGLVNEYRAEKAAEALHSQIHHRALAVRDRRPVAVDVTALVPVDIVDLALLVACYLVLIEVGRRLFYGATRINHSAGTLRRAPPPTPPCRLLQHQPPPQAREGRARRADPHRGHLRKTTQRAAGHRSSTR